MKITCFKDFTAQALKKDKKTVVAIVEAQDEHTLESVVKATNDGIIVPLLIGNERQIKQILESLDADFLKSEIMPSEETSVSITRAIEAIHTGRADAIMKGKLESGDFMKALVNKENHLLESSKLSLAGFYETQGYHKLFVVSDMGLNTYPGLDEKRAIIENAVRMLNTLGIETPKVAVLAAVEKLNPKMPETVDADALKQMNKRGDIQNCIIEGPISFDLATHPGAARIKGFSSPVAGDADLLIVPDIVSGNILVKCLTGMAGAQTAGTILGAKIPVVFTSRSAEASDKYYSLALAACLAADTNSEFGIRNLE